MKLMLQMAVVRIRHNVMPLPRTEAKLAGSITSQESLAFIMWASQQAKTRTLFLPMEKSNDCCERYYDLVSVMLETG
jgi:hypothetical protein